MTTQQMLTEIEEKITLQQTGQEAERLLVRDTLEMLKLLTVLFRQEMEDIFITISEREGLEWDSRLRRFVYHRDETSHFLEMGRKEVILRIRPFLKELGSRVVSKQGAST